MLKIGLPFLFFLLRCTTNAKTFCKSSDEVCKVASSTYTFQKIIEGIPSLSIKSSESIHEHVIEVETDTDEKLEIHHANITGFIDCTVEDVKLALQKSYLNFSLSCPHIAVSYSSDQCKHDAKSDNGQCIFCYDNHIIRIILEVNPINGYDNITYMEVKRFDIPLIYTVESSEEAKNCNQKHSDEEYLKLANKFKAPIFQASVANIVNNIDFYVKAVPVSELFFELKDDYIIK